MMHRAVMIVSPRQLAAHLHDPAWIIFDCRHDLSDPAKGAADYAAGHIEGAFFAGVDRDLSGRKTGTNGRHPLPDPRDFVTFLARAGATAQSRVVAYDDVGGQYAARLWWMLRWIGLDSAAVLDGGWDTWRTEGLPTTTAVPDVSAGALEVRLDPSVLAGVADVEAIVAGGAGLVVDARAPERYRGEIEPLDPVAGHIPGAANHFFKKSLRDDLTFKSPEEIRAAFAETLAGVESENVVHQCGSGITACVNLLAMELAGLKGSKLYAGSWSEWVADPQRPIA